MKIEQQVVSLELAKRLKELGVKQESIFYWWTDAHGINKDSAIGFHELFDHKPHNPQGGWKYYSAFTVAELGEMLPEEIHDNDQRLLLRYSKYSVHYILNNSRFETVLNQTDTHNEANARAKMLIYLIENKLQTISEEK